MTAESKKDVVFLYQFPPAKTVRNVSPFCLKIESFLRIHNIPYENKFITTKRSKYGLVPFIELNGQQIADSQIIQERLKEHFKVPSLPMEDEAVARCVERMVDQHTFHLILKFKLYDNPRPLVEAVLAGSSVPGALQPLAKPFLSWNLKSKAGKRINTSLGMFTDEEFKMLLNKDLDAIRDLLNGKLFLFGDRPTTPDCTVFGHLASIYYLPYQTYVKEIIHTKYPTLVQYMDRFIKEVYPNDFTVSPTDTAA